MPTHTDDCDVNGGVLSSGEARPQRWVAFDSSTRPAGLPNDDTQPSDGYDNGGIFSSEPRHYAKAPHMCWY